MNVTFLIGNGFDLNAGLETTYSAFLKHYVTLESDSDVLKYFKESILKDANMWSNAEMAFGAATQQFKADLYTAEDFCICHEDFCIQLAKYLQEQEQRLHYTALKDTIAKGFAKGLLGYKKGFREAEAAVISASENAFSGGYHFQFISFNYTAVVGMCHQFLKERFPLLGKRSHGNLLHDNTCEKLMYVHGTVDRDMVLGVNDIGQIADTSLFENYDDEYINELIKQKTNEANEQNMDRKVLEVLKASDLIYIYGMSIGETDKLWWERICTLMAQKNNLHLIIHRFDAPEDGLIRRTFRLFTSQAKREFTAYSKLDADKKKEIEARIHIDRTNIFSDLKGIVNSSANTVAKSNVGITA